VTVQWEAPDTWSDVTLTAIVNPDRFIEESNYDNNSVRREVAIIAQPTPSPTPTPAPTPSLTPTPRPSPTPRRAPAPAPAPEITPEPTTTPAPAPLPDFAVTGFRETRYTTLTLAKSYVKVANTGGAAQRGVILTFDNGMSTQRKSLDFAPNEEKEVVFEWFTPQKPGALTITAEINPNRTLAESDYSNNRRGFNVDIALPPIDLSVATVVPDQYPAGKKVLTLVEVRSEGERDLYGDTMAGVKLTIPSINYTATKLIAIERNTTQKVPFVWTAPPGEVEFAIVAEVNPSRAIDETNYDNNTFTLTAKTVVNDNPSYGCDNNRTEWIESVHTGTIETPMVGPDGFNLRDPDGNFIMVEKATYKDVNRYMEVKLNISLSPVTIKSGYGVECQVSTAQKTNSPIPIDIVPLQDVFAYLPMDNYKEAFKLEPVQGNEGVWQFPVNPLSLTGARVVYVPVNWPDNENFIIKFTGRYASSPDGNLCSSEEAIVTVIGSMYDDDYTAPLY